MRAFHLLLAGWIASWLVASALPAEPIQDRAARNQVVVSPNGPEDGGDFGPKTPGTKTSGLQEALDAAKAQVKDVYIAGGSWTVGKNQPVVYHLHETLHVPWMQDFRLDSGHCVINYTPTTGDAVVFDSQMSCSYRMGLIVSMSDGAVVRLRPGSAGPDHFQVITSTEFVFNALVGGGGAWPGGEAFANELNKKHKWKGTGLWLDGAPGSIDANKITVIETVGCATGLKLSGAVSRNTIESSNIHLCVDHVAVGDPMDARPADNRIEAFMDSQGISPTSGARVFGSRNLLTLSTRPTSDSEDLTFGETAADNVAFVHSAMRVADRSLTRSNRVLGTTGQAVAEETQAVPDSGTACRNERPWPVEVRILTPGRVQSWSEQAVGETSTTIAGGFIAGQSLVLNPGDSLVLHYDQRPTWRWKPIR